MSLTLSATSITGSRVMAPVSAAPFVSTATTPSSQSSGCNVYLGAEARFAFESGQVADCFKNKNMPAQSNDLISATHFFLFVTDSFLKSKEHVLPLISKLSDPHFKQRLFPVIMDKKMAIFSPGSEHNYVEYWDEILNNTNTNSSEYGEVKTIKDSIAPFICAVRDTLMPPLDELLHSNLAPITEAIEKRLHLLEKKRFFFLPTQSDVTNGRDVQLAQISSLFANKNSVTVSGESGIGKTTLAIEYAKSSEVYPSGIFWLNAKDEQTLEEGFRQLAVQLGMSVDQAKRELHQMTDFLLIYDNVANPQLIQYFPSAHSLVIGVNLAHSDITLGCLTDIDADRCVQDQLNSSADDARSLAEVLKNHPGKLKEAIAYIKSSKITVPQYVNYYLNDHDNLIAKQQLQQQIKGSSVPSQPAPTSILDPLPQTIEKFSKQTVSQLSQELKNQEVQIFVSYNWGAKDQVEQIDSMFKTMGIELLRDARELRNFESIREFMKKVIRQADYTFSIINNAYLKSFNCLFEVITTMQDPQWRNRVFPSVLPEVTLDDAKITEIETHWQKEAERLEKAGGTPAEIAIAKEGAKKIAPYLRFVQQLQPDAFSTQLSTEFQKTMALMLARQEVLEKKGIYKQAIFHLPMGRNKDFTGRDKEMTKLEESLKQGQYSAITNTGMGGVGKSQLALEYAYRHQKEYEMLYWIRSEDMGTLKSDLRMLGLEMGIAEDFLKDDKVISTMKGVLEKQKKWLLVFDNAEDPKALAAVMPQRGGHIIVTSRNKNWERTVGVDVFSKEEALHFLQKISGISGQEEDLKSLAEDLGYLPLALTQAGAYIRKQQIDVATYRSAYKEEQKKMLSQKERGYPGSVATAWLMSMEKIAKEDPNAEKLLNICSFLAPDNIPEAVLEAWLKDKNKKDSGLDFQDALRILESYSLIDQKVVQKEGTQKKLISIHRLIQAVTREECKDEEATSAIQLGIDVLNRQFKGDVGSKEEREAAEALVGHAQALIANAEEGKMVTEKVWSLTDEIGLFLFTIGDLAVAKEIYQRALKMKIDSLGTENHLSIGESYNDIGRVLTYQSDLQGALDMYQRALKIKIACLGTEEHTSVANSYNGKGRVLSDQGDLKGALEMHQKALKIQIACLGTEEHTSVANSYHNIGAVLYAQEDYKGALEMYQKALKIAVACLGMEEHTSVAESYLGIGSALFAQDDLKGALEMHQKALKIKIACLGTEEHTSVAQSYNYIGVVLQSQGDLKGAFEISQKALRIKIACLGTEEHISVADSYICLGQILYVQGDLIRALEIYQKALKIKIACLGTEEHGDVSRCYNGIGLVLQAQGDLKGALEMYQKALKIEIACLGTEEHTNLASSYMNLGDVYLLLKENKQAREHYLKAKRIDQKTTGDKYNAFYDGKIKACGKVKDIDKWKWGESSSSGTSTRNANVSGQHKKKECVVS